MVGTLVMAPKSVTFRRHDHLVSVLFGDLLSHSYNITFSMFLYLVLVRIPYFLPWQLCCVLPMDNIILHVSDLVPTMCDPQ